MEKILQIIPTGYTFLAIYEEGEKGENISLTFKTPVACWALVEDEKGNRKVEGMDTMDGRTVDFCEKRSNFLRYTNGRER